MIVAETDRLILRRVQPGDAPFILALLTDPDFRANIGDRGVDDLASAEHWASVKAPASYAEHGFGAFVAVERASGAAIGTAGLYRRDGLDDVDVGYAFLPAGRGKGYALEAVRAVLGWAASNGVAPVVAIVDPGNARSIAILERVGMAADGRLRLPGADHDVILYVPADIDARDGTC